MPHRQFLDTHGTLWTVWDVHPSRVQRDLDLARHARLGADAVERTEHAALRLDALYASGWLCFDSGHDKRRLAPIPAGWELLDTHELASLFDTAEQVRRPRRIAGSVQPQPQPQPR